MKAEFRRKRMELAKTAKLIFACSNIHKSTAGKVLTLSPAKPREENYFPVTFKTNESCSLSNFLEMQFMRNKSHNSKLNLPKVSYKYTSV